MCAYFGVTCIPKYYQIWKAPLADLRLTTYDLRLISMHGYHVGNDHAGGGVVRFDFVQFFCGLLSCAVVADLYTEGWRNVAKVCPGIGICAHKLGPYFNRLIAVVAIVYLHAKTLSGIYHRPIPMRWWRNKVARGFLIYV